MFCKVNRVKDIIGLSKAYDNGWAGEMTFEFLLKLSVTSLLLLYGFLRSLDLFGLGRAAEYVRI